MNINIYMFHNKFIADIVYEDGKKDSAIGAEMINEKLNYIYAKTGKNLTQLISEKVVSIKQNVWEKYSLEGKKIFVSIDKDNTKKAPEKQPVKQPEKKEPEKKEPEKKDNSPKKGDDGAVDVTGQATESKKDEEKKDNGKKGITLKKVAPYAIAAVIAIGSLVYAGGVRDAARNNLPNTPENTPIVYEISGEQQNEFTFNTSPEETIVSYSFPAQEEPAQEESFAVATEAAGTTYRYVDEGSAVKYSDMDTQIQVINDACFGFKPCELQNLVVESDYSAIETISNMRNRVLNGSCDPATFMNNVVNYIFEGGTVFDGRVIKAFDSLSPFGQYIVLVSSQSILQLVPNYEHTTTYNSYNFDILVNSYNYMVDATYRQLTDGNGKTM